MANVIGNTEDKLVAGVLGESTNTTNEAGPGVWGKSKACGVLGESTTWHGVGGLSKSTTGGAGVYGQGLSGSFGVLGESTSGAGVEGRSQSGTGVFGQSDGTGVWGKSKTWDAVFGESQSTTGGAGVHGKGVSGNFGVLGESTSGAGIEGRSQSGIGIVGKGGRLAGLFEGHVDITGNLTIQGVSIQVWLQRIARLEQEVISLRHQLATHTHSSANSSGGTTSVATIHVEIDLSGFSQSFAIRRVSGGGFNSGEALVIKTSSSSGISQSSATARADGTYQQELSVSKNNPPKQYSVWAEGASSGRVSSKAGYSV